MRGYRNGHGPPIRWDACCAQALWTAFVVDGRTPVNLRWGMLSMMFSAALSSSWKFRQASSPATIRHPPKPRRQARSGSLLRQILFFSMRVTPSSSLKCASQVRSDAPYLPY
jgi:hypothetical protein